MNCTACSTGVEPPMRFELMTSPLPRERSTPELRRHMWAELDSNQRKLSLTDLQSVPISHSGTDPYIRLLNLSHHWDLNPEPPVYKTGALPIELWWHSLSSIPQVTIQLQEDVCCDLQAWIFYAYTRDMSRGFVTNFSRKNNKGVMAGIPC